MAEITSYRPDDRRAVDALYRRVFGNDAAEASRLRWEWQYGRNPNNPGREPEIWIAREGKAIVGQYATMPVQVSVKGEQVRGSWGMDVMVAPERQRQGLGELLFRTWDRHVGVSLGPRPVGVVSSALPEAAMAGRRAAALPGQAADAACAAPAELAAAAQPARVRCHAADREDRVADASDERRGSADPALRRIVHRSVGRARAEVRPRGQARCGVL